MEGDGFAMFCWGSTRKMFAMFACSCYEMHGTVKIRLKVCIPGSSLGKTWNRDPVNTEMPNFVEGFPAGGQ